MIANLNGRTAILFTSDCPDRVEQKTGILFRRDKLNCAESVFRALLEENGNSCPLKLLRTASAFGHAWEVRGVAVELLSAAKWLSAFFSAERRKTAFARMCAAMLPSNCTIDLWNITSSHVAVYCTRGCLTARQNNLKPAQSVLWKPQG